jgi:hypothetical protein
MKTKMILLVLAALPLAGNAQVSNLSFEIWDNPITEQNLSNRPTGWYRQHPGNTEPTASDVFYAHPTTTAQSGNYALTVAAWYNYTKDLAVQAVPYTTRPSSLKGFYKYTGNILTGPMGELVDDIAQVRIFLTKWNTVTLHRDTIGWGYTDLNAAANYTEFTNQISYSDEFTAPDSIRIILDPSLIRRTIAGMNLVTEASGSFFTVDNLTLIDENVASLDEFSKSFKVYPNPVTDLVFIENFNGHATIYDMNGKLVNDQQLENQESLSFNKLVAGTYLLQLNDGNYIQNLRIVKK